MDHGPPQMPPEKGIIEMVLDENVQQPEPLLLKVGDPKIENGNLNVQLRDVFSVFSQIREYKGSHITLYLEDTDKTISAENCPDMTSFADSLEIGIPNPFTSNMTVTLKDLNDKALQQLEETECVRIETKTINEVIDKTLHQSIDTPGYDRSK